MHRGEGAQSLAVRQRQVKQHDVHLVARELREPVGQARRVPERDRRLAGVSLAQHLANQAGVARIVLDQQRLDLVAGRAHV